MIISPKSWTAQKRVLVVKGKIEWISGPAVKASGMAASKMYEVVEVGEEKLVGEVTTLTGQIAFCQVYESTTGLLNSSFGA